MSKKKVWMDFYPTEAEVARYEYLQPAIDSLFSELKDLSKKKPDALVTAFKLRLINKALTEAQELLYGDPSLANVEELTEDSLPQVSDVVLVLGQFIAALHRFRAQFHTFDGWRTDEVVAEEKAGEEGDEEESDD